MACTRRIRIIGLRIIIVVGQPTTKDQGLLLCFDRRNVVIRVDATENSRVDHHSALLDVELDDTLLRLLVCHTRVAFVVYTAERDKFLASLNEPLTELLLFGVVLEWVARK